MKTETLKDKIAKEHGYSSWYPFFTNHSTDALEKIVSHFEQQLSALQQENEKLREIAEWVAERFGKDYPGSTVGIMGRKAAEIISNQR